MLDAFALAIERLAGVRSDKIGCRQIHQPVVLAVEPGHLPIAADSTRKLTRSSSSFVDNNVGLPGSAPGCIFPSLWSLSVVCGIPYTTEACHANPNGT